MVLSDPELDDRDPVDEPFPNEPTVDDPGVDMPGEDPGAVDAPGPDETSTALDAAAETPISR
jgi:hypothetical protein